MAAQGQAEGGEGHQELGQDTAAGPQQGVGKKVVSLGTGQEGPQHQGLHGHTGQAGAAAEEEGENSGQAPALPEDGAGAGLEEDGEAPGAGGQGQHVARHKAGAEQGLEGLDRAGVHGGEVANDGGLDKDLKLVIKYGGWPGFGLVVRYQMCQIGVTLLSKDLLGNIHI